MADVGVASCSSFRKVYSVIKRRWGRDPGMVHGPVESGILAAVLQLRLRMPSTLPNSRFALIAGFEAPEVDLTQPAIVPEQWEWGAGSLAAGSAEARLMLAVLNDAISSVKRLSRSSGSARSWAHATTEGRELEKWFESTDRSYAFSFENICATFDIESSQIRIELRRFEHRRAPGPRLRGRHPSTRPARRRTARVATTAAAVVASLMFLAGASHGFAAGADLHGGDLPNLEIPKESKLEVTLFLPDVTLDDGARGLLDEDGSAVVIHRDADDYETAPAGDAEARIACGVVEPGAESGADPEPEG